MNEFDLNQFRNKPNDIVLGANASQRLMFCLRMLGSTKIYVRYLNEYTCIDINTHGCHRDLRHKGKLLVAQAEYTTVVVRTAVPHVALVDLLAPVVDRMVALHVALRRDLVVVQLAVVVVAPMGKGRS